MSGENWNDEYCFFVRCPVFVVYEAGDLDCQIYLTEGVVWRYFCGEANKNSDKMIGWQISLN